MKSVLNILCKDWCWSWSSNPLATGCEELTYWKRPWCWERLKAGGEGDIIAWDGWIASPTQWIWVWTSSGGWWWTGKPGVLQPMGSQRVIYDWVTELNWVGKWIWSKESRKMPKSKCLTTILLIPLHFLLSTLALSKRRELSYCVAWCLWTLGNNFGAFISASILYYLCLKYVLHEGRFLFCLLCWEVKVLVAHSCLTLCDPMDCIPTRCLCPWNTPGRNSGVGSHYLLQGIFLTQESDSGLLHCREILYCLSHREATESSTRMQVWHKSHSINIYYWNEWINPHLRQKCNYNHKHRM